MRGCACIRGLRSTVSTVVGLVAQGETTPAILAAWPYLEPEVVRQALACTAWPTLVCTEREIPCACRTLRRPSPSSHVS